MRLRVGSSGIWHSRAGKPTLTTRRGAVFRGRHQGAGRTRGAIFFGKLIAGLLADAGGFATSSISRALILFAARSDELLDFVA